MANRMPGATTGAPLPEIKLVIGNPRQFNALSREILFGTCPRISLDEGDSIDATQAGGRVQAIST